MPTAAPVAQNAQEAQTAVDSQIQQRAVTQGKKLPKKKKHSTKKKKKLLIQKGIASDGKASLIVRQVQSHIRVS